MLSIPPDVDMKISTAQVSSPYLDPALRGRKTYGHLLGASLARGIVEAGPRSPALLGLFCVAKKSGQLRVILDTRLASCYFKDPPRVRLPSNHALAGLDCCFWPGAKI